MFSINEEQQEESVRAESTHLQEDEGLLTG